MTCEGNQYKLETLDNGVISFRHLPTGEILHGTVGPEREAQQLYLASSGLQHNRQQTLVVFDVGLGCAAQILALLDFLNSGDAQCKFLRVFSFDLEKDGLTSILDHAEHFPLARKYRDFVERAVANDTVEISHPSGIQLQWNFVEGDFRRTITELQRMMPNLKVDAIFYDFFSPASHPWLWTCELFEDLYQFSHSKTRLVTHSSATCVKAALAAAGWWVGQTIASGKKSRSIVAATGRAVLDAPLPVSFLSTFERSHKPFCDAESDISKEKITKRLKTHPQFNPQNTR